jgi:quinoprotein glucose dehydrogenase
MLKRFLPGAAILVLFAAGCGQGTGGDRRSAVAVGDWPMFRHDLAGTGHSPLAQINSSNVNRLARAWSYGLAAADVSRPGRGPNSEATPIVIGGRLYLPAADRVVALDAATGREIWRHTVDGGAPSRRGVAYWPGDGAIPPRILFTAGRRLIAVDAATGVMATGFGGTGEVDLAIPYNSVPLVYHDIVVVGANTPPGAEGGIGNARAYDAVTGRKLWEFSSVPPDGAVGHGTWVGDSWRGRLGVNAWPFYFTLDADRGLLYIPLASPIPGAYGGDRAGANLFGNSVVAVDVQTGEYRWHFQTIHHDLWDADPPAPPSLFDVSRNGETIPALALTTKSGYMYILNRETGDPIFGVEERPVPASDVPGEAAYATQPFPVQPPPIARNSFTPADLVTADDTNEEHARLCGELVASLHPLVSQGPFTPWAFRPGDGSTGPTTLVFPGGLGGANWGGTAVDPANHLVFVVTQDVGALGWVHPSADAANGYAKGAPRPSTFDVGMNGQRWPCQKPPWGRIMAIDTSSGAVAWQMPLGVTDALPPEKQHTGRPALAGPISTESGLLFVGSTDDDRFRALDAKTGAELWSARLPARGNADPIAYADNAGKEYVAIVATDTLLVYALP